MVFLEVLVESPPKGQVLEELVLDSQALSFLRPEYKDWALVELDLGGKQQRLEKHQCREWEYLGLIKEDFPDKASMDGVFFLV